jgi:hypothetical protein
MAAYLYCIRNDPRGVPPGLIGIDGATVRSVDAGGLSAWVSDVSESPPAVTVERLRAHDGVCMAALDGGDTPLPIRFGQTFPDDRAAADAVAQRGPALRERLARVAGCVELRVIVSRGRDSDAVAPAADREPTHPGMLPGADPGSVGRGTAFLHRLARVGRADLARDVACEELRHAVRASAKAFLVEQERCEAARGASFFAMLVRRPDLDACRAAIAASLAHRAIGASLVGPFPPYSFAGDV